MVVFHRYVGLPEGTGIIMLNIIMDEHVQDEAVCSFPRSRESKGLRPKGLQGGAPVRKRSVGFAYNFTGIYGSHNNS